MFLAIWIRKTVLKGTSFWQVPIPPDCSWIWKKVLKLRDIAKQHISYSVGNGADISLWFDLWILGFITFTLTIPSSFTLAWEPVPLCSIL